MTEQPVFRYSVIVPIFRNRDSLPLVVARLEELARNRVGRLEAVFVVDGSPDDSLEVLKASLEPAQLDAQLINLSRNFGSFSAIRAGIAVARGDFIAVMAADLQEPIEVVATFFDLLEGDQCDIAFGQRVERDDPESNALSSGIYWSLYRRFVNPDIPDGGIDVFGCTRQIADLILGFHETHTSLVGLLFWVGYRRSFVPYKRAARHSGRSAWTLRRKVRYMLDSVYAFTDLPITLLQLIGVVGLALAVFLGIVVFAAWAAGSIKQPGYTPIMILILASTSAILAGLGVVGSYVWRSYENGKIRPVALVASHDIVVSTERTTLDTVRNSIDEPRVDSGNGE